MDPGTRVGPYVIESPLGRGGMGAVFVARREADGARVALKLLLARPDEAARRRFEREAQLAARLSHPGIVGVHGAGVDERGQAWLAMDLVEGEPLTARVGRVAPREAARLVAQVARAIEHAHARGVLHRDLKPANVLVRVDGQALVTDFGVARALDLASSLTKAGALVGTPCYMAPEQVSGLPLGPPADVHALGALLHETLTGAPPFDSDEVPALIGAILHQPAPAPSRLRPETPAALDALCRAALQKDPAARPSAGELAAGLEAVAAGSERRRVPGALALGGVALALALGGLAALAWSWAPASAPPPAPTRTTEPPRPTPPPRSRPAGPPPWLEALPDVPDLAELRAARDAVDAAPLDDASAARLLRALRRLQRTWEGEEPRPQIERVLDGPSRRRLAHLALRLAEALALVARLDPGLRLTATERSILCDPELVGRAGAVLVVDARYALRALELLPAEPALYGLYSRRTRGDPRVDLPTLRRGIAVMRDDPQLGLGLAAMRDSLGMALARDAGDAALEELTALARDAEASRGEGAQALVAWRAAALAARGQPDEALAALDEALALGDSADLLARRAVLLEAAGERARALADARASLAAERFAVEASAATCEAALVIARLDPGAGDCLTALAEAELWGDGRIRLAAAWRRARGRVERGEDLATVLPELSRVADALGLADALRELEALRPGPDLPARLEAWGEAAERALGR